MLRIVSILVAAVLLACVCGCGGGSGSGGGGQSVFINILTKSFSPRNATVNIGVPIHFVNNTGQPRQVVSGVLLAQGSTSVVHLIRITSGGLFSPASTSNNPIEADLGDSIRFSNDSTVLYTIQVFNANNIFVFSRSILAGQLLDVTSDFLSAGAGLYTFSINGVGASGAIVLYGFPQQSSGDNSFISPVLGQGETFTRIFGKAGSVPFFELNLDDASKSFKTGMITVQ